MPSIKKNLLYNFLLSLSQVLLPLVSIPYVSRVLDPDGIGRVSFMDAFTYYFISIAEFGIVVYGMREVAKYRDDPPARDKIVSGLLSLHMLTSAFTLVLYTIAVFLLWSRIQDIRLVLFSLSFLLVNSFACEWYFLGMERFRYITLRTLLTRVAGLVSIFLLVKQPADYYIYYAIIALSAIVSSLWNNYLLIKEVRLSFRNLPWKSFFSQTRYTYAISLLADITLMLDIVFLRLLSLPVAVGLYAFSMKIVRTSSILLTDPLLVFFPRIVALVQAGETEKAKAVVLRNLQLLIFFGLPMSAGIFLLAEPVIRVVLGEQFLPALTDLRLLAFYPLLKVYNLFLSKQVLIVHHHERAYMKSLLAGAFFFIATTIPLSSRFADTGACIAILLSELVTLCLNLYYCRKYVPYMIIWDGKAALQSIAGIILFVPVIWLVQQESSDPLPVLLIAPVVCCLLYLAVQGWLLRNELALNGREILTKYLLRRS